jgi:hypothetical protein
MLQASAIELGEFLLENYRPWLVKGEIFSSCISRRLQAADGARNFSHACRASNRALDRGLRNKRRLQA